MGSGWQQPHASAGGAAVARQPPRPSSACLAPGLTTWRPLLELRLLEGDEAGAWDVVERALDDGLDAAQCYVELVADSLTAVALRCGRRDLADVQLPLAVAVAQRLVACLGGRFRSSGSARGTVVLGAPSGERHGLPLAIVADVVRLRGFDVLELGADVGESVFVTAVTRTPRVIAVGLGVTQVEHVDAARRTVEAIHRIAPAIPVLAGGQAVRSPEIARLIGATAWGASAHQAAAVLDHLAAAAGR